jgi:hypothetical protein
MSDRRKWFRTEKHLNTIAKSYEYLEHANVINHLSAIRKVIVSYEHDENKAHILKRLEPTFEQCEIDASTAQAIAGFNKDATKFVDQFHKLSRARYYTKNPIRLKHDNEISKKYNSHHTLITLNTLEQWAQEAITSLPPLSENIDKWISSNAHVQKAKEVFNKKNSVAFLVPEIINNMPRFPLQNEGAIRFTKVIIEAMYSAAMTNKKAVLPPTNKSYVLATKLLTELQESDSDSPALIRSLKSLRESYTAEKPNPRPHHQKALSNHDIARTIALDCGREMKRLYSMKTSKGRPYPDVIVELLEFTGYSMDLRQANRVLSVLDNPQEVLYDN